jgi:hypothetical protein
MLMTDTVLQGAVKSLPERAQQQKRASVDRCAE